MVLVPCLEKNEGNDSQSAAQSTIKVNGWFAKRFDTLGWTAAVLCGAGGVPCFRHQIKQSVSYLAILTRKRAPGVTGGVWRRFLVPCSVQSAQAKPLRKWGAWKETELPNPPSLSAFCTWADV